MTAKTICKIGNDLLIKVSQPVIQFDTPTLHKLIADMLTTMQATHGAGLAAPQIGINLQVMVFGVDNNPRYPTAEKVPQTVLINPDIKILSQEKTYLWEGCLSVPGLRGLVPRFKHIYYCGYDVKGNFIEREVSDFHARVVQHEYDHLNGILMPQRVADMRQFGFESELKEKIAADYEK